MNNWVGVGGIVPPTFAIGGNNMNRIDRLLHTVKSASSWCMLGFVEDRTHLGQGWSASCRFWDGVSGSNIGCDNHLSYHPDSESAVMAIKQAADKFPYDLAMMHILIDDIPGGDASG